MPGDGHVCIIGAGLGGLAAAVRLAARGYDIEVFEKQSGPGGKASVIECDGFRFDAGPSLLTMPFVVEQLFADAGADASEYLSIRPLDVLCRYWYPDGPSLDTVSDPEIVAATLADAFGQPTEATRRYFEHCAAIFDLTGDLFLFSPFLAGGLSLRRTNWVKVLRALFHVRRLDANRTMHDANAAFFDDPRAIQIFDRRATYAGSNPYSAPGTLNIIQHVDYAIGGYRIDGGVYSLVDGLTTLARNLGVRFHFNTPVQRILTERKRITGLQTPEGTVTCTRVISNADVNTTYRDLLDDTTSRPARRYRQLEPSSSAIVFYWGVNAAYPQLDIHNILFSADYAQEFADLFDRRVPPTDPTIYIYVSSKYAPDHAPEGSENLFTMVNAPYDDGQDWPEATRRMRDTVLAKIQTVLGIDLAPAIACERVLTPPDLAHRTASNRGSIYGISSNSRNAAFLRQSNRSNVYPGLYFCGGSAHPGGGMPLVLLSGKMAAQMVEADTQ